MSFGIGQKELKKFILFTVAALIPALLWLAWPLFSLVALVVIPVCLALLVCELDLRYGLSALLVMSIVLFLLTAKLEFALLVVLQTGPLGLLMGLLYKNKVAWGKALAVVVFFSLLAPVGIYGMGYLTTGENPFVLSEKQRLVYQQGVQDLKQTLQFGSGQGLDPSTSKELEQIGRQVEAALPVLSISSTLIWFMTLAAFSFFITRRVLLQVSQPSVLEPIPFSLWKLPWYSVWGVIAGLVLMLGGDQLHSLGLASSGKVLLWIVGFVFAVIGISVYAFFLRRWRLHWSLKITGLFLAFIFLPNAAVVLAVTGIVDALWNIRRLTPERREPEEEDSK